MKRQNNVDYSQKILEVKNLKQYFRVGMGKRRIVVKAVDGISFDVYKREVFGLVGESGCGKTTTGRTIIKLYNPTDGEVIYNGNTIGMGHEGHRLEARMVKRQAKKEILYHQPLKKQKHEINEQYKFDLLHVDSEFNKDKQTYEAELAALKAPAKEHKQAIKDLKEKYNLDRAELLYDEGLEKKAILVQGVEPILKDRKYYLKASKTRFNDKVDFIQSMKIEKFEKSEQIALLREQYHTEIEEIEKGINDRLRKHNIDVDCDTLKDDLKEQVAKEKAEKKEAVKQIAQNYAKKQEEIKQEFITNNQELRESYKEDERLSEKKETLVSKFNERKQKYNEEKTQLSAQRSEKLAKLNEDFKANPDKYVVNNEEIAEIKRVRNEKIQELRGKIRFAKDRNKLKESAEEREIRLAKKKEIQDAYSSKCQEINESYNGKINENLSENEVKQINEQRQKDLAEARRLQDEQLAELDRTRPNFTNYVSSIQMIFQDPISSLNPRMIVSDIISEGLRIRGERNKEEIRRKVYDVLNIVGLDKGHATRYPHEFSGGQRQRIGVARAIIVNPQLLIADEPISALDVSIQAQVINLLNDLKEKFGLTILFIAHDLSVVKYFSDRIAVMYMGKIVEMASSEEIFAYPLHPYTKSLLSAIPYPDPESERERQRILYNPMMHDYREDKPTMREIRKDHFIYANDKEYAQYLKEIKKGDE